MGAGARVLKIDVQVDETGEARRNLAGVEQGIQKVEATGNKTGGALAQFTKNLTATGVEAGTAAEGVTAANASFAAAAPILGGFSAATVAAGAAVGGLVIGVAAVSELIRRSSEYYAEQSGVLDVNREAVERLKDGWNDVKFAIGEATVGNAGDFSSWIDLVTGGLVTIGLQLATDIALFKEFAQWVTRGGFSGQVADALMVGGDGPGVATARRNRDGSMTAAGDLALFQENERKRLAARQPRMTPAAEAEALFERDAQKAAAEATRLHNKELHEQEAAAKAVAREQHQLAEELRRVGDASREAYDTESAKFFLQNTKELKSITASLRDDYASMVLSKEKLAQREIEQAAAASRREVLDRGTQDNTDELLKQIDARRQLSLLQLKKDTEGVTDELQQQFLIFAQTYGDVLGGLPTTLQDTVAPIAAASGEIRDVMTTDIQAIGTQAQQTFAMVAVVVQRTSSELRAAATQITNDLEDMTFKGQTGPFGYRQFQEQTAQKLRNQADLAQRHETQGWGLPHFASGVTNFRGGSAVVGEHGPEIVRLPGGSDVIPNGRGMGGIQLTIDARGANFTSEASIELLADRVQQKLAPLFIRFGG